MSRLKGEFNRVLGHVQKMQPDVEERNHLGIYEGSDDWGLSAKSGPDIGYVEDQTRTLRDLNHEQISGPFEGAGWHRKLAVAIVRLLRERGGFTKPQSSSGNSGGFWLGARR